MWFGLCFYPLNMDTGAIRVLVIDDDASVRESIVDLLSFLGHHVDEASNGADGIELFACQRHDVVMTDLRMPGLTGWDVIEQVRRIDPEARVVLCTACATSAVIERARLAELPVVFKPIRLSELQAVIRPRLRGGSGLATPIAHGGARSRRALALVAAGAGQ